MPDRGYRGLNEEFIKIRTSSQGKPPASHKPAASNLKLKLENVTPRSPTAPPYHCGLPITTADEVNAKAQKAEGASYNVKHDDNSKYLKSLGYCSTTRHCFTRFNRGVQHVWASSLDLGLKTAH